MPSEDLFSPVAAAMDDVAAARPLVACLCAAWCGTCAGYQRTFERVGRQFPGCDFAWIDIEDDSDVLGEVDVETFPTLLIAAGDRVRFYGVLTPQPETLARTVRAALDAAQPVEDAAQAADLLVRVRAARRAAHLHRHPRTGEA